MMGELDIREAVNDYTCPRRLTGESHYDGRIWLGATWEIRTSIGAAKTDQLVMSTLLALTSEADFDEAGRGLLSAATRLVGTGVLTAADQAEVDRVVNARGLPGCIRIIDLYDPATGEAFVGQAFSMGLEEMGGYMDEMASGIQFRIRTPPTAARVSLAIHPATIVEANAYDVYMRQDAAVHFSFASWSLTIDGYDSVVTGNPDGFTMAGWSTPPLVPGADYYFTFVHRNPTAVLLSFTASVALGPPRPEAGDGGDADAEVVEDAPVDEATPEVEPDVVLPDAEPDVVADTEPDAPADTGAEVTVGGGCGCRTIPAGPSGLFAALLFGAALLFRRRG
jgi:MYXO-CTERM domain-containing protein